MLPINLTPQQKLHGFIITKISEVLDGRAWAIQALHEKTGAQLLHLYAEDAENLFAIALATPPTDDTGLPHILEHTVLCGSQKYPVKDPFVELLKTSMATFLNAMTYPDRTIYPCASMNERDYFNLMSVYCDAVFRPLLLENHFRQEGHHFDFAAPENRESDLLIKGIVYNEMKGAYSDLDGVLSRDETKFLFPDNAYGRDSGGDPLAIPQLTYQQFKNFHQRYYHPSNAKIFMYGNVETAQQLEFLDREYLSQYARENIDTKINAQPKWNTPRQQTITYPATERENSATDSAVTVTWFTGEITDTLRSLSLNVLDEYLLANSASPLRKALIDSHLGGELTSSGYIDSQRDTFFSVGLKAANAENAPKIEQLILDVCRHECAVGLDAQKIASVFMQFEMSALEIKSAYPLRLMDLVYRVWTCGGDPLLSLQLREQLAQLRQLSATTPRFFEDILQSALVDNPHRLTLTVIPDAQSNEKTAREFSAKMAAQKQQFSDADLTNIQQIAQAVAISQNTPNSPAALATLPKLTLKDVAPKPIELPTQKQKINEQVFLTNEVFTNGINYVNLAVDVSDFDQEMLRYLPVYSLAMTRMGAGDFDYARLAELEAECCSGIGAGVEISAVVDDCEKSTPRLHLSVKALNHKIADALKILQLRFYEPDFSDVNRLKDILTQSWQNQRSAIIGAGHTYAAMHAARNLSVGGWWRETLQGITQARLAAQLAENFNAEKTIAILSRIKNALTKNARFAASVAGDNHASLSKWFGDFTARNGGGKLNHGDWAKVTLNDTVNRAIVMPCEVAFVAEAFNSVNAVHSCAPSLLLLSLNLTYGYLWNEVRVQRGAYGCGASFSAINGQFTLRSFRDPLIKETLQTYHQIGDYVLNKMDLSPAAIAQAIIGTIKTLDHPLRPGYVVAAALSRELTLSSNAERQNFRTRLLNTTKADIEKAVREHLSPNLITAPICVIANHEKLTTAKKAGVNIEIEELV